LSYIIGKSKTLQGTVASVLRRATRISGIGQRNRILKHESRWLRVVGLWPPERFIETTDLQLSRSELRQLKNIHDWRFLVPKYVQRLGWDKELVHVYCFGMAHCDTVKELISGFSFYQLDLPHLNLFDSFEGLPDEIPGIRTPPNWGKGAYAKSFAECQKKLEQLNLAKDHSTTEGFCRHSMLISMQISTEALMTSWISCYDID
jgi:hypothetical protein